MVHLSVNVNKIATLRNSRGGNHPNLLDLSYKILTYGADGITIHPREDERHIRRSDILPILRLIQEFNKNHPKPKKEFNIEGEPSERFLKICMDALPDQATLVPVTPGEITSDHGFQFPQDAKILEPIVTKLKKKGIRVSLFVDPGVKNLHIARELGADRIELYTGPFAHAFDQDPTQAEIIFQKYIETAKEASQLGLGINAGHDLDHQNLKLFQKLPGLIEVSIGHRLISQALEWGLERTIRIYKEILS